MTDFKPCRAQSPFASTSLERRKRVIEASISEFAAKGFSASNINNIARSAGISIGSMYSYFESKEDLFLECMHYCLETMYQQLSQVDRTHGVAAAFNQMLKLARKSATENPEMNQMYLDCSSESLRSLSEQLSVDAEAVTVELYKEILEDEIKKGTIRPDLDVQSTSFMLDNLVMMYQFSFVSGYYNKRKKLFLGGEENGDNVIEFMTDFVKRAIY